MSTHSISQLAPQKPTAITEFLRHCHIKKYPIRSTLIHPGDESETLYYIISGSVSVTIEDQESNEVVLSYLNPGDFFGELGLFQDEARRCARVVTRAASEVAQIHYKQFMQLAQHSPEILFQMSAQLADRVRKTSRKVGNLAFMDVTGRIARTLLDLAREPDATLHPKGMQIRVTRQEIAKIVGCSREMAGRVLKNLQQEGLITARGKTIVIFGSH